MKNEKAKPGRQRWSNATLVRERDEHKVRGLWVWLLGFLLAFAPTAVYLLQQMEYVRIRYRIEALRVERHHLEEQERQLRVERATLEALPRVESRAAKELGLVRPSPKQVVLVHQPPSRNKNLIARAPEGDDGAR